MLKRLRRQCNGQHFNKGRLDSRHSCYKKNYVDKELTYCATVRYGSEGTIVKGVISTL